MSVLAFIVSFLMGYILGAFPTGFFAGKLWGVDVRKHGSGRTGGTNVLRSAGWGAFAITFIGDVFKGALSVWLSRWLFPENVEAPIFAVLGALVGHNWSVWIAILSKPDPRVTFAPPPLGWFQRVAQQGCGGAGVAPTVGAVFALFPPIVLIMALPILLILIITRYASVASLSIAIASPLVMLYFVLNGQAQWQAPWSYLFLNLVGSIVLVIVHIPNIQRLRAGTEKKFGQRLGQRTPRDKTDNPVGPS